MGVWVSYSHSCISFISLKLEVAKNFNASQLKVFKFSILLCNNNNNLIISNFNYLMLKPPKYYASGGHNEERGTNVKSKLGDDKVIYTSRGEYKEAYCKSREYV